MTFLRLLSLLMVITPLWAKSPPPGAGTDMPANIMLMLDTSGSMGWTMGETFERPYDIAVDSAGNTYLTERYNNRISKFDSAGTLLLSWGSYGYSDGQFRYPMGVTVDSADNLYVADRNNSRIQKFSADGTHLATIGSADLYRPMYVAVDSDGNIYATEYYSNRVSKFSSTGSLLTRWGSYGSDPGQFRSPRGIVVDHHNHLFVADTVNHRIQKFDTSGNYINQIGGYGTATGNMIYPSDIAYGQSSDVLYVMDRANDRIQRFNLSDIPDVINTELTSAEVTTLNSNAVVWGSAGSGDGAFNDPYGIGVMNSSGYSDSNGLSDGDLLVAGYRNNRYQRFSFAGSHELTVGASSRLEQAKKVIKAIVSDSDLTQGANFGLITWNSSATTHTCVSRDGAQQIRDGIDSVTAGGSTYLDNAMQEAESRFNTACWPYDGTQCTVGDQSVDLQKNFVIVISDGVWDGHAAAENIVTQLNSNYGVKTFVIGFMLGDYVGDSNYEALADAGNPGLTPPASPLYAENWEELYLKLALAIRKAIDERLEFSFTSPVTMPALRKGNYLYRSHFIYHKEHQWEGHLTKYALSHADGTLVEPPLWDAGEVLNQRDPSTRKIFTVDATLPAPTSSLNNFIEGNVNELAPILYPPSAVGGQDPIPFTTKLIRFIRGHDAFDEYDEFGTETNPAPSAALRWKLADIYNSEVAVVSAPVAGVTTASEQPWRESYYRYINGYEAFRSAYMDRADMVYAGSNGGLLHAFKASDGSESWAFIPPPLLDKLHTMDVHQEFPNGSNSIYGIDGSIIVKDIKVGAVWKTVLMAGFGAGANGYFALDVTDVDSPQHLFSVENLPEQDLVKVWAADGTVTEHSYATGNTIDPEWNYALLGESWSTPVILNLKTDVGNRWVAVFGSGYNQNGAEIDKTALFVMDLESGGKLLMKHEMDELSGTLLNALPSAPLALNADAISDIRYSGAIIYIPDFEGTLWKIDLTDSVEPLPTSSTTIPAERVGKIFRDSAMTSDNGRLVFNGVAAAKGSLWLYYSTSDQLDLYSLSDQNRIYGILDPDFPSPRVSAATASTNIEPALYDSGLISSVPAIGAGCPPIPERGWYAQLNSGQKVTDLPNVKAGTVYYPIFTPDGTSRCEAGMASVLGVNMYCGNTVLLQEIGKGVLKGGVHHRGQTYYSLGGQIQNTVATESNPWSIQNNVVVSPVPDNRIVIDGWREDF